MNTQEFLILPPEEVCKLLASDDLNIPNEEIIYQALLMWVNHELAARKKFLPKLMSHIRLPLMSPQVRVILIGQFLKRQSQMQQTAHFVISYWFFKGKPVLTYRVSSLPQESLRTSKFKAGT